jgi:hypothetical protein
MRNFIYKSAMGTLFATLLVSGMSTANAVANTKKPLSARIPFIENQGQLAESEVRFYAPTFGGTLFVKQSGEWIYNLPAESTGDQPRHWAFQERLLDARSVKPQGRNQAKTKINYFKGKKDAWRTNIASYDRLMFSGVYPGIDLKLQARAGHIEKIFVVAPHAKPEKIRIGIDGVQSLHTNDDRQLVLSTGLGPVHFTAPVAFQIIEGKKQPVDVSYVVKDNEYGFKLGKYDRNRELIIDPLLASTFIGGDNTNATSDFEFANGIVERDGFVFIAGTTDSSNFPTHLGYDDSYNGSFYDGFIAKFDTNLSTLVASTFLGGASYDDIWGMALDDNGTVYVVGRTGGNGFPATAGGYRYNPDYAGGTFVANLSNDLSTLFATAFPAGSTLPAAISVGNSSVYLSGRTNSPSVPATPGALDTTCGGDGQCDPSGSFRITKYYGYVERLTADLSTLLAATYLGEAGGTDIDIAASSDVYVVKANRVTEAQLARLDATLSSQLGVISYSGHNAFNAIDIGPDYIVTTGFTRNPNLPITSNAYDPDCGTDGICDAVGPYGDYYISDVFVGKYSMDLQTTLALTYFGGSQGDDGSDISIDELGNIIITGGGASTDIPTTGNAYASSQNGGDDGFIAKFNSDLSDLLYASYIGGGGNDDPAAIYASQNGHVYIAGNTNSTNFPTTGGAFDTSYNGGDIDVFVSLFDTSGDSGGGGGSEPPANQVPIADAGSDLATTSYSTVYLDGSASSDPDGDIVSYQWQQDSGKKVTLNNADSVVANFVAPRVRRGTKTLTFQLTVVDDQGVSSSDQVTVTVSR